MTGTETWQQAAQELKSLASTFVITLGAEGSAVWDGKQQFVLPTESVEVIDTNGAGDMYAGAFLYGLTHNMDYAESAALANRAASRIVGYFGPRLPADQTRAALG